MNAGSGALPFALLRQPVHLLALGFGAGPHVCLGLKLARAETQIVLQQLFTRWPDLQPTFESSTPDWSKRLGMRSLNTLKVKCP